MLHKTEPKNPFEYQSLEKVDIEDDSEYEEGDSYKNGSKDGGRSEWTTRRKLLLVAACMASGVTYGGLSMIMPYFPIVALEMGISNTVIGFIFSSAPLSCVLVSPLTGYLMTCVKQKYVISGGLFLAAAAQFMFGLGKMLFFTKRTAFVVWSLVFRVLAASGALASCTALMAILPQECSTNYATALGITELFSGVGLAVAPSVSGAIYHHYGFFWPTAFFGFFMALTAVSLVIMFWRESFQGPRETEGFLQTSLQLIKIPKVLVGVESVFVVSMAYTFLEPVYALFGTKVLHLNTWEIGVLYIGLWVPYLFSSLFVGSLIDKIGRHLIILSWGFFLAAVGFVLVGPDPVLLSFLPVGTIWLTLVAEICIGLGLGAAYIPPLPYMVEAVKDGDRIELVKSSVISGMFYGASSLGVFAGPTLAGILADFLPVRQLMAVFGYPVAAQGGLTLLYLLFSSYSSSTKPPNLC